MKQDESARQSRPDMRAMIGGLLTSYLRATIAGIFALKFFPTAVYKSRIGGVS